VDFTSLHHTVATFALVKFKPSSSAIMIASKWRLALPAVAASLLFMDGVLAQDIKAFPYDLESIYNAYMFPAAGLKEDLLNYTQSGLVWKEDSKLLVEVIATDEGAESLLQPAFEASEFEKTACSKYRCSGYLPMKFYQDLVAFSQVTFVHPSLPIANQAGSTISEALQSLMVDDVRATIDPALDGTGLIIGILSDSYDASLTAPTRAADDVASGDLPNDVVLVKEISNPDAANDKGRAMAHDK